MAYDAIITSRNSVSTSGMRYYGIITGITPVMDYDTSTTRRSSGNTTIMSFDVITTGRSSGSTTAYEL